VFVASQALRTGNEGVTPIISGVTVNVKRGPMRIDWVGVCNCRFCFNGSGPQCTWPDYYLSSVTFRRRGRMFSGRWVGVRYIPRGSISYECYLERSAMYCGAHPYDRGSGSTSSPSAAAIAELEKRNLKLENQDTHLSEEHEKAEARENRRVYREAFKQGWRFTGEGWLQIGEILSDPPRQTDGG
jgi:hypothetical protein